MAADTFVDNDHVKDIAFTEGQLREFDEILTSQNNAPLSPFWQQKYRSDQAKNWELFYKRNETNFFKDRSWLTKEFTPATTDEDPPVLDISASVPKMDNRQTWNLIDLGCGVGNALFPLLDQYPECRAHAFDVSKRAVEFLTQRADQCGMSGRIAHKGQWDLINDEIPVTVDQEYFTDVIEGKMDIALLLFVLSAIPPEHVKTVVRKAAKVLRVGGSLWFRDYGRYDEKEIRFAKRGNAKLEDHLYVRQDGTLANYFDHAELDAMMREVGLEVVKSTVINRQFTNRKTKQVLNRCWLQAIYKRVV